GFSTAPGRAAVRPRPCSPAGRGTCRRTSPCPGAWPTSSGPAGSRAAASPADCRTGSRTPRAASRAPRMSHRRPATAPVRGTRSSPGPPTKKRSHELPEQADFGQPGRPRRDGDVWLVAVAALHEVRMVADRDPPVLELAAVAVDRPQLHHHLVGVELDHDVDLVLRLQR